MATLPKPPCQSAGTLHKTDFTEATQCAANRCRKPVIAGRYRISLALILIQHLLFSKLDVPFRDVYSAVMNSCANNLLGLNLLLTLIFGGES